MAVKGTRVVLVVPSVPSQRNLSALDGRSPAGTARRAWAAAGWLAPGAGLEIFVYGWDRDTREPRVVHASVASDAQLAAWSREWAVEPTGLETVPNGLARTFAPDVLPGDGAFLTAVHAVDAWAGETGDTTLVIFRVAAAHAPSEAVRIINAARRDTVFWQFYGVFEGFDAVNWRRDGLARGRLLPNVRYRFGDVWGKRGITRGFRKWLLRNGGGPGPRP